MRKRLLLIAGLCMFALPLLASNISRQAPAPINVTAMAGHVVNGLYYCDCGSAGCQCEATELPPPTKTLAPPDQTGPVEAPPTDDLSVSLLFGALLVALLLRIAI